MAYAEDQRLVPTTRDKSIFSHPEFTTVYLVNTIEEGTRQMLRRGFRRIAYGGELWLYRRALAEGIEGLRTKSGNVWRCRGDI